MMLATLLDPGVTEVASVLACLFFLVAGANQVKKFLDGQKDKPAPADVRADLLAQLARTDDCIARHNAAREETAAIAGQVKEVRDLSIRLDREWQHKLDERMEHAEDRSRKEIGELHEKINGIGREVSEMSGQLKTTVEQLGRMDEKLDSIVSNQHCR